MTDVIKMDGRVFGKLTVMYRKGTIKKYAAWMCQCTCGEYVTVSGYNLRAGLRKCCARNGHFWAGSQPPSLIAQHPSEHQSWRSMCERCFRKENKKHRHYGGRGITVCERWQNSFANFFSDMGAKPTPKHTIDRINNDGNYEPSNCKWSTNKEQSRNMRRTVYVEHEGQRRLLMDVADSMGISRPVLYSRLKNGWSMEEALTLPVAKHTKKKRKKKRLAIA